LGLGKKQSNAETIDIFDRELSEVETRNKSVNQYDFSDNIFTYYKHL
tara:strand:- start:868 stop:1008 length:141 start_codon:yes stop_codon:yes gene_type:complete